MDPRYQWPQQGYPNGQYAQPMHPNGYPPAANGFPPVHPQQPQPMMPGYPASQPVPSHPQVIIPPRLPQQYQTHPGNVPMPQAPVPYQHNQPQVVIPPRNSPSNFMGQGHNPKIRQVQVPAQRSGSGGPSREAQGYARPPQNTPPNSKPVHQSQSHQENMPRPQQRNNGVASSNPSQHRSPLQNQAAAKHRTPSSHSSPAQPRHSSLPQTPGQQARAHPQYVIKPNSSATPKSTPSKTGLEALPVDMKVLLLTLADEYINAARGMGSLTAMAQRQADLEPYQKLMATGLGCMEAVLKKCNQNPRDEAKLRLRYATLLVEETENDVEIEDVLTKGIAVCSRNHLVDLKYSMQHLFVRYQAQTNHRAAFKTLDGHISESETFRHVPWIYAFRFLRVSLALQVSGRSEIAAALNQLHAIAAHAQREGDRAIFVTCHVLEAMVHIRTSAPDHLEQAQRAIATARSLQLQTSIEQLGQIAALIECVDVAYSLQIGKPDHNKMAELQAKVDRSLSGDDGSFSVLIEHSSGGNTTAMTGGIFTKTNDGRDELVFSWLPKRDVSLLAFYLSGVVSLAHDQKGPTYLKEGLKITQDLLQRPVALNLSLPASVQLRTWTMAVDWHIRFTLGLIACRTEDMPHGLEAIQSLRHRIAHPLINNGDRYTAMLQYLSGIHSQLAGQLDVALMQYSSPALLIPDGANQSNYQLDVAILANMHRILILLNPLHREHYRLDEIFKQLEPICSYHPHLAISSAFKLIRCFATIHSAPINRQKTLINNSVNEAQQLSRFKNFQLITMVMNFMSSHFYTNGINPNAVKSVRAARNLANQNMSSLWRAVAVGLGMTVFQRNGMTDDAVHCQSDLERLWDRLPVTLREHIANSSNNAPTFDFSTGDTFMQGDTIMQNDTYVQGM